MILLTIAIVWSRFQLNDHLHVFGKELFVRFTASAFRKLPSIYVLSYFPFGFEGRMWVLIVSVPDYCLSFLLSAKMQVLIVKTMFAKTAPEDLGFLYSYWSVCSSATFSTWNEPAIFYNHRAHALFHVLHANLRWFWCSMHVYRCRIRTTYKTNT